MTKEEAEQHFKTHLPQLVEISRAFAAVMGSHVNIAESALVVRLACGFESTLTFSLNDLPDTTALLRKALAEAERFGVGQPPGVTVQ